MTKHEPRSLYDHQTGRYLRPATKDELRASEQAGNPEGVFELDGRRVYVVEWSD